MLNPFKAAVLPDFWPEISTNFRHPQAVFQDFIKDIEIPEFCLV